MTINNAPTHLDLFSGIGGFAIAAQCAGFRTVAFCESDSRCREFLEKTWQLPVAPDIKQLDGRRFAGIPLVTGGPPCQPASRAGKQGGEGDDRWLWPEALRVLAEAKPDSVVFENPPGIGDVGLDGILSEMGGLGYEVQCFDIPACAVDSPQLRRRIWIVGFFMGESDQNRRSERERWATATRHWHSIESAISNSVANSCTQGHEKRGVQPRISGREECSDSRKNVNVDSQGIVADSERERWSNAVWVPCADGKLRRAPDDSFDVAHGLHRSILGALGNSICPQVATEILKTVYACFTKTKEEALPA